MRPAFAVLALCAACAMAATAPAVLDRMTPQQRANNFWAVLVAGSNTWNNYRHQADVCHMFQVLRRKGVPEAHIIVLMYDDIAQDPGNYRRGVIINEMNGPDVYSGVPKDVVGSAVTPDNFVKVLLGEKPVGGSGKTLGSTSADHVFIFYSDHGDMGSLRFPGKASMSGERVVATLKQMYDKQKYGVLVFFVEACEAGSVFYKYTLPPRAYVATASPISDPSWATDYDSSLYAYLGDSWSQANMWYMDNAAHNGNSLQNQFDESFEMMKRKNDGISEPCQYGDLSVTNYKVSEFFGATPSFTRSPVSRRNVSTPAVRAWDVSLEVARQRHRLAPTTETAAELSRELHAHREVDRIAQLLVQSVNGVVNGDPPCKVCSNSECPCFKDCVNKKHAQSVCRLTCCGDRSDCFKRGLGKANDARNNCVYKLGSLLNSACGRRHEYLQSLTSTIHTICRNPDGRSSLNEVARTLERECTNLSI
eukprot:m51a1_g5723 hypothetical protein (478) ;mRNA; r:1109858-1111604